MPRNSFSAHLDAIKSGYVTRTNVIGLRKALNSLARIDAGFSVGTTAPKVPKADVWEALHTIDRDNPRVTGELHDSGLKTLRNKRYAKRLAPYADLIQWPSHFELCGFEPIGRYGQYHVPIYRLVGQNGGSFKFINIPWQSGGNGPEIF